eukprot:PITA_31708
MLASPTIFKFLLSLLLLLCRAAANGSSKSRLRDPPASGCLAWQLNVESGNLRGWYVVPPKCVGHVKKYMMASGEYWEDSRVAVFAVLGYVETLKLVRDGKDAWILDIDETLLSNIPYYQQHEFGGKPFNVKTFEAWVSEMKAPALPWSLLLYNRLLARGFSIFLITGRDESRRNTTAHNLLQAGYKGWSGLFLRGKSDQGIPAGVYKPKKRGELVKKGYRLWGSVGDQWSDLSGPYEASRSFKLPNPMYYIS